MTAPHRSLLTEYIHAATIRMTREPSGVLTHPYTVPSAPESPFYSDTLWDWDSWFISVVMGQVEVETGQPGLFGVYEEGTIRNFLDHMDEDGVMPILIKPGGPLLHRDPGRTAGFTENMHKPIVAQQALLLARRRGSTEWLRPERERIGRFLERYVHSHMDPATGLAYWQTDFAIGVDNDPSVYYRPDRSTASVYLNSLLYREMLAFGALCEDLGDAAASLHWRGRAADLADAVNALLWDERDGMYYSADLHLRPVDPEDWLHRGAPRRWNSLLLRIDNWSSFLPLWAGIAPHDRAERVRARIADRRTFRAAYGVRTLSRLEQQYDLRASNNPSNWLGPVWGISNYLVFRALARYGFDADAAALVDETVALFGRDLAASGALHEYYHPDTGEPIMTSGFQNWNFLVLNMMAWQEGRPVVAEF